MPDVFDRCNLCADHLQMILVSLGGKKNGSVEVIDCVSHTYLLSFLPGNILLD